jgi:hypothetical protein
MLSSTTENAVSLDRARYEYIQVDEFTAPTDSSFRWPFRARAVRKHLEAKKKGSVKKKTWGLQCHPRRPTSPVRSSPLRVGQSRWSTASLDNCSPLQASPKPKASSAFQRFPFQRH